VLPRRRAFGRPRILVVGCGDIGLRCAAWLRERFRVFALTTQPARFASLRSAGLVPLLGDLDDRRSLARAASVAREMLHLAPPQAHGTTDRRTAALLAALGARRGLRRATRAPRVAIGAPKVVTRLAGGGSHTTARRGTTESVIVPERPPRAAWHRRWQPGMLRQPSPVRIVYMSTTGVYGDCDGALVDETRPVRPVNARAVRRASAERQLRRAGSRGVVRVSILRVPGIYALERLPVERLRRGTPALCDVDDVYTGHVHAHDLAAITVRALFRGRAQRVVHAVDTTHWKMGEYFDRIARACDLRPVPRITRQQAETTLDASLLSFMRESRRLANRRLRDELMVKLRYPSVEDFLREHARQLSSVHR
jgi:nucleoside-diphosphate-sugar epimerase